MRPGCAYDTIGASPGNKKWVSAAAVADYGDAQALWIPPTLPFRLGIAVGRASLFNINASAVKCGLAVRYPVATWAAGQVTAAGAYTADTTDAQSATTGDFSMHDRADSGSGFLLGADLPFNIVGLVQSAAGDQTTPVKIVEYWDGAAWVDIVAALLISDTLDAGGTGEKLLMFPRPSNWVVGGTGTGVPATSYNLRVRHTHGGAGTANPVASQVFLGHAHLVTPSLAQNAQVGWDLPGGEFLFPRQGEALFPFFSTADRGNHVEVAVRGY